jgi:hypothetical protein
LAKSCSAFSNLFNKFSAASSVVFIPGSTAEKYSSKSLGEELL